MALAIFVFLPMVVLFPAKFVLCFTVGSVAIVVAFAMLNGPKEFLQAQISRDRLLNTSLYLGSICMYFTFHTRQLSLMQLQYSRYMQH